jgi:hypothetical protein
MTIGHNREGEDCKVPHARGSDPLLSEILAAVNQTNAALGSVNRQLSENSVTLVEMRGDLDSAKQSQSRMTDRLDEIDASLTGHMGREEMMLKEKTDLLQSQAESIQRIAEGFPINPRTGKRDPNYHAGWHEDDIDKSESKKRLKEKLREWVILGALGFLVTTAFALLITGTKVEIKRVVESSEGVKK